MEDVAVREAVAKSGERVVHVLGLNRDIFATVIIFVRRLDLLIQQSIVVALIQYEDSVVSQSCVVLCKRFSPVLFLVQMGKGIAETDE
jgi:hypothetical protein